jgi:GPH family glycoside/pentoside/hexuronide:cation symporter
MNLDLSQKLSFKEKMGYGFGDAASCILWQAFSYFLLNFYTDVYGIAAAAAGTMLLVTRIWDTAVDPVVGIIIDRTETRWGKFRPYILWMILPFAAMGVITFTTPDLGPTGKLVYAYITYTIMMVVYSAINVPYSSLLGVLSANSMERASASSYRFILSNVGGLMIMFLPVVAKYMGGGSSVEQLQVGYRDGMAIFVLFAIGFFMLTFFWTKERVSPPKEQKTDLKKDISDLLSNKPWLILLGISVMTIIFMNVRNASVMFYSNYILKPTDMMFFGQNYHVDSATLSTAFLITGMIANILGIMFTGWIPRKFGKKPAYIFYVLASIVTTLPFFFVHSEALELIFILQLVFSFVSASAFPLIWALFSDTADYSEWKNHRRATGLIFSASSMSQKLGWAVGGAMAAWILAGFGYRPGEIQSSESEIGIKLLVSVIPAIFAAIGLIFMMFYKLDDKTMLQIEKDLAERRK